MPQSPRTRLSDGASSSRGGVSSLSLASETAVTRSDCAITTTHFALLLMGALPVGAASLLKIQWGSFQAIV